MRCTFLRETWKPHTLCSCDPVDVVANVATGGLYGVAKGAIKIVKTGDILGGVADMLATFGIAGNILQPIIGTKNTLMLEGLVAGGALAMAPAGSVLSGGFGAAAPGGGVAPLAATPGAAGLTAGVPVTASSVPASGIPLAPGVAPTGAEVAGATLTGPVGATAAPAAATAPGATGLLTQAGGMANDGAMGWTNQMNVIRSIPSNPAAAQGWFSGLPDIAKYAVIAGGTQLISGAASGLFAGMSAEQKLALEKLVNEQNQTQRQRLNAQNAYAPSLKFKTPTGPAGLLTKTA